MFDFLRWREVKEHQPQGSLVYAGEERHFEPSLLHCTYDSQGLVETCLEIGGESPAFPADKTHFLMLTGVHDVATVARVGQWFGLHPLLLEDVLNTSQGPRLEWLEDDLFLTLRDVVFDPENIRLTSSQVSLFQSESLVLAFQEDDAPRWEGVLSRLRKGRGRMRSMGAPYLLITLLDALVDRQYAALGGMSAAAEAMEERLDERPTEESLLALYQLKREIIMLRNTVVPTKDILDKLADPAEEGVPPEILPFLNDVRGHAAQVTGAVHALHDILAGMLDLHLSLASMRMNGVMKLLTLIATIFIPLTFLAGIYGMNFDVMPELHWRYGYPLLMLAMAGVAGGMLYYFKRSRWL
ncbi:MAG: magnesium/cobalt transporter CorA [Desulfovibrionaceae bacterium]